MADIVPLDRIQIPEQDDLPPLRDLVTTALAKRPDLAVSKIQDENGQISAKGTTNALLPTAQGFLQTYDRGAAGSPQIVNGSSPNPYFKGGYETALGQIFRRDFPNNRAGVYIITPLGNRVAQGDYGVEQLQLRQSDVSSQRSKNQIVVDISNEMVALRQARARYAAAVETRTLQETLLKAEQNRFVFGATTISNLIIAQRNLSSAQTSELNAMAAYANARVSLDQVLGQTLDVNHVALADALKGQASRSPEVRNGAR
jgi:outer membrane protein